MTKVYLVSMHECNEKGFVTMNGKTMVDKVFTNKMQAIAYVNEMNTKYWRYEKIWFWNWECRTICKWYEK